MHTLCPITLKEKDAGSLLFFEALFQSRSILAALGLAIWAALGYRFFSNIVHQCCGAGAGTVLFFINIVIVQAVGAAAEQAG